MDRCHLQTSAICPYPGLRDSSCSPSSGVAVGRGASEMGRLLRRKCAHKMLCPLSPTSRPPLPKSRGCPKDLLCRIESLRFVSFPWESRKGARLLSPGAVGSRPATAKSRVVRGARSAVARRRPRVSRLRARLAAREPAFSDEEWVTRCLIPSSRYVCPRFLRSGNAFCFPSRPHAGHALAPYSPRPPAGGTRDGSTQGSLVSRATLGPGLGNPDISVQE